MSHGPLTPSANIEARQKSRESSEQANYLYTQHFLEHYARFGHELARLGARCLELNQTLGFCDPKMPWTVSTNLLKFDSVVTLPIDAALKVHFCLEAWLSTTPQTMRYEQMCFVVEFDENELQRALMSVVKFLESLQGIDLNNSINVKAEELADALKNVIVVKLTDLTINEKAVEMFCHSLRGQAIPHELRLQ
ncbi:hypothetical protein GYMLUDRAFT_998818 [Collybiopsis luxurians FD-317 M1]|uniref:Uncharacterized protein n=1 Tax=Collybiopsis luxurians FD-317 M1 TaxID=944289 RepID=A0A0D0BAI9_9AGAR|nr:hypothetical protein GYMLUDRAFT_998818 [Collybiopsis luxurians FD-317 M1]